MKELRAALEKAGITLPSPLMDPASSAREASCPRVEWGGCSIDGMSRLAAALR